MSEEYLKQLEKNNKICKCPSLSALFEKRETAGDLEAKCRFFNDNADFKNPRSQDLQFLVDYQAESQELKSAVQDYSAALYQCALNYKIYFSLHDTNKEEIVKRLSFDEARKIPKESNSIMTLHCSSCNQQIDFLHSID